MKKAIICFVITCLLFSLCACGSSTKVAITLKDGTSKNMTIAELNKWKEEYTGRKASEFEEQIADATVSGSGKVVSVKVGEPFSLSGSTRRGNRFLCTVTLDNGIILDITLVYESEGYAYDNPNYNYPGDIPEVDIYEKDNISFSGTINANCISKDTLKIQIKSSQIGKYEKKVGLKYIPGVEIK